MRNKPLGGLGFLLLAASCGDGGSSSSGRDITFQDSGTWGLPTGGFSSTGGSGFLPTGGTAPTGGAGGAGGAAGSGGAPSTGGSAGADTGGSAGADNGGAGGLIDGGGAPDADAGLFADAAMDDGGSTDGSMSDASTGDASADGGGLGGFGGLGGAGGAGGIDASAGSGGLGGFGGFGGAGGFGGFGGAGGFGGTGATGGVGGFGGTGGALPDAGTLPDAGADGGLPNSMPGYVDLSPPMLTPLDPNGNTTITPAPPAGWKWYPIADTQCRDGSPAGLYAHFGTTDKLYIYFEGGGACTNNGFCNFNPPNLDSVLTGTGETVLGTAFGVGAGRQQPGVYEGGVLRGIFDTANASNPVQDWNGIYIPYCTGDVHFGSKPNATVAGVAATQQFVGYLNTQKFIGHIVPTFKDSVDHVVVTGASAGSFGAALNFSMIQDAFGDVLVDVLMDSGVPFTDTYMPVCMQKYWRDNWNLNAAMPPDCAGCFNADGGGMLNLADFLVDKHPNSRLAVVSGLHDEVMRLFFSMGLADCANITTADPVGITIGQLDPNIYMVAPDYEAGLEEVRARYVSTGRFATYFLGDPTNPFDLLLTYHQHTFRARFYDPAAGTIPISQFVDDWMGGTIQQIFR